MVGLPTFLIKRLHQTSGWKYFSEEPSVTIFAVEVPLQYTLTKYNYQPARLAYCTVPYPRWSKQETADTDSALAQTVSRRLLTATLGLISRQVHVGFVVEKIWTEKDFSPSTSDFSCQFHSTSAPRLLMHLFIHSFIHHRRYTLLANDSVVIENPLKINRQQTLRT